MNPLQELTRFGQSVWLDYIRRSLISSGELKRLIDEDGLRGVTSNPAIFEKAIVGSNDYSDALQELSKQRSAKAKVLYEQLAIADIQDAADILLPVYQATHKIDGYVSLEVSPYLARDTQGTIEEARRLWRDVNRKNVMIKVPGTDEGIPAIHQLISEGVNINVTLLFSQDYYAKSAEAFLSGLEARAQKGESIEGIASVASFFISRIDSLVDSLIEAKLKAGGGDRSVLEQLEGKIAIANAKQTYQSFKKLYAGPRWQALENKGAQKQRLLWASTSTKNPKYPDVLYVEELIGAETVNTIPPATFDAFRDHGRPKAAIETDVEGAAESMRALEAQGISFAKVCDQLLEEGIKLFADAFDKLLKAVETKRQALIAEGQKGKKGHLFSTGTLSAHIQEVEDKEKEVVAILRELDTWSDQNKLHRLWARDASLWTNADEANWMGWLSVTESGLAQVGELNRLAEEVRNEGMTDIALLGMGGSSLCPQVLQRTFGNAKGFPRLHVLDSTDPAQIATLEKSLNLPKTLFIVSSKSGGTLEPNIYKQYFFAKVATAVGAQKAGQHFVAVTDPGTKLEQIATKDGFRKIFHGVPSIGGRYSALSNFGMVPAALMGVDVKRFFECADEMVTACSATVMPRENPGVLLGVMLGVLANMGRDKVTLVTSPKINDLGAWLEQLLAESTGKVGKGLIPLDREKLGPPEVYSQDRVFAYVRLDSDADPAQDKAMDAVEQAGHPVVRLHMQDIYHLGAEFFRWEIATAVAGSIIGINAFNQPDVEASKIETRKLTSAYEDSGKLPPISPLFEQDGFKLFADDRNAAELKAAAGKGQTLVDYLRAHLGRLGQGDYFNISAYIEMNEEHERILQDARAQVRDKKKVATCLGFGPRFLHSTGQAYKGGPNSGVFLQVTCDDAHDLPVPDQKFTFGIVKECQARGDFAVLAERGRRALRVHLSGDLASGLKKLVAAIQGAIS